MRLDHLLSKEHLELLRQFIESRNQANVLTRLAHGWNITLFNQETKSKYASAGNDLRSERNARCWVLGDRETETLGPFEVLHLVRLVRIAQRELQTRNRPYFENYIVDASIFRSNVS